MAPRDILPGLSWASAIVDGIDSARAAVLVFSSAANNSQQIEREVQHAIDKGLTVVPFRIEDVKPREALAYCIGAVQWLDALAPPMEASYDQLSKVVRQIASLPPPSPLPSSAPRRVPRQRPRLITHPSRSPPSHLRRLHPAESGFRIMARRPPVFWSYLGFFCSEIRPITSGSGHCDTDASGRAADSASKARGQWDRRVKYSTFQCQFWLCHCIWRGRHS